MTVSEIFSALSAHFIKGLMIHDQLADYYDFLSLRGYKRCHEYHFKKETCSYRKLHRYYLNQCDRLIPEQRVDNPNVIPETWYRYAREDVDVQTKKDAVKSGVAKWVDWEEDTLDKLQKAYADLYDIGEPSCAIFIEGFIKDVEQELKYAKRKQIELEDVEYSLPYILDEQKRIHDTYKRML